MGKSASKLFGCASAQQVDLNDAILEEEYQAPRNGNTSAANSASTSNATHKSKASMPSKPPPPKPPRKSKEIKRANSELAAKTVYENTENPATVGPKRMSTEQVLAQAKLVNNHDSFATYDFPEGNKHPPLDIRPSIISMVEEPDELEGDDSDHYQEPDGTDSKTSFPKLPPSSSSLVVLHGAALRLSGAPVHTPPKQLKEPRTSLDVPDDMKLLQPRISQLLNSPTTGMPVTTATDSDEDYSEVTALQSPPREVAELAISALSAAVRSSLSKSPTLPKLALEKTGQDHSELTSTEKDVKAAPVVEADASSSDEDYCEVSAVAKDSQVQNAKSGATETEI